MKGLKYIVMVWVIGVLVSPILIYFFTGMNGDFIDLYFLMVMFGGMFSLISELVLILIFFFLIRKNFHTVSSIKLATNITMIILTFLTFLIVFLNYDEFSFKILRFILPYIITMSVAVWYLKLDIEKKEEISFVDDDVL